MSYWPDFITTFYKGAAMSFILPKKCTTVSAYYKYVVGIDTHAKKHVFVLINSIGERLDFGEVRVLTRDFEYLLSRISHVTGGDTVLFAIEGTSSYGETITRFLIGRGVDVCEVKPPRSRVRGGGGKTDQIDAEMGARGVLPLLLSRLIFPRLGDHRKMLRVLLAAHHSMTKQQTMDKCSLMALVRGIDLGVDARDSMDIRTVRELAMGRVRSLDMSHERVARMEAKRLARSILDKELLLAANLGEIRRVVCMMAPSLLSVLGVGPISAATILCVYSYRGRVRSAAAFAAIAGVAPIPACSGNVVRHRLNRYGDRSLNKVLTVVAMIRMRSDDRTKRYVDKRTAEGRSFREIRRSLKGYIARELFRHLEALQLQLD